MASLEQRPQGLTGLGGFGRHRWPVTLRRGPVILAPLRQRDRAAWSGCARECELAATVWRQRCLFSRSDPRRTRGAVLQ